MHCCVGIIMSRISKNPIEVPDNVEIKLENGLISVKGPLGLMKLNLSSDVEVKFIDKLISIHTCNMSKHSHSMSGTVRTLIANMIQGVIKGFEKKLTLVGVGYRAQVDGDKLNLNLGFSHPA